MTIKAVSQILVLLHLPSPRCKYQQYSSRVTWMKSQHLRVCFLGKTTVDAHISQRKHIMKCSLGAGDCYWWEVSIVDSVLSSPESIC